MKFRHLARVSSQIVIGIVTAAATSLILMGQLGRYRHSLDQLNALIAPLLVLLALCLAIALGWRDRVVVAVAGIGLAVGAYQLGGSALHGWRDRPVTQASAMVKILTLSTYHSNPAPAAIRDVIAAQAPDVVMLQETNGTAAPIVEQLLYGYYRLGSCKKPDCTLTILSRWPMRHVKIVYTPPVARPDVVVAEIDAPFGRFRVMNLHLPRPYDDQAKVYTDRIAAVARANRAQPLIMAGDFNTASASFGLDRLERMSGLRRRDGFIPTYPANELVPAFTGIDHVFADSRFTSSGCRRTQAANSDHYGIACRLQLKTDR